MAKRGRRKKKQARISWDFVSRSYAHCPLCQQRWQGAPDVLVSLEHRVARFDGLSISFRNDVQPRVLQVLTASYGRPLKLEEILLAAYSDLPDIDQPADLKPIQAALRWLAKIIAHTDYQIQTVRSRSARYRLIKRESTYDRSSRRPPPPEYAYVDR